MRIFVVTIAVAAASVLGVPLPASADTSFSISGSVALGSAPSTAPGAGEVTAIATTVPTLPVQPVGASDTDSTGKYTISGLAPGTYYLYFRYNGSDTYRSAWAGEAAYATTGVRTVTISTANVTGTAGTLYRPTTISGHVTLGSSDSPADPSKVTVSYATTSYINGPFSAETTPVPVAADGSYTFADVGAGFYRLHFTYSGPGQYESVYFGSRTSPVANEAGVLRTIAPGPFVEDVDLPDLVSISGHVSAGSSMTPVGAGDATVSLRYFDQYSSAGWTTWSGPSVDTDTSGNYSFTGLLDFDYQVVVKYNGVGAYLDTTTLSVADNGTPERVRDVTIPAMHSLRGHVYLGSSARSASAGEVEVRVFSNTYNYSATVTTDADGNYAFPALPESKLNVTLHYAGTGLFVDTPVSLPECDATCSINLLTDRSGVDGTVRPANTVSGSVQNQDGVGIAGLAVAARSYTGSGSLVAEIDATTDSNGRYSFASLPNGEYEFTVSDPHGGYASTVIDAAPNRLTLNYSQPQQLGITRLTAGATVSGVVTIVGGSAADLHAGAATVQLLSQRVGDGAWVDSGVIFPVATSGGINQFVISGVSAGSYKVRYDYHGQSGDAVAFSSIIGVGPEQLLSVPTANLYPEHPASTVADFSLRGGAGTVSAQGWAAWPSSLSTAVGLAVNIGSAWYSVSANQPDTHLNDFDTPGTNHGFSWSLPLAAGTYTACLWTTEPSGPARNLGCSTVTSRPLSATTFGLDSLAGSSSGVNVAGWAQYPDAPSSSVGVALNIGANWYGFTANQPNTDPGAGVGHGYSGTVALGPGTYTVCIWVTEPSGSAVNTGCQDVTVPGRPRAVVHNEPVSVSAGILTISGWDVFPDAQSTHVGMALNIGSAWYGFTADSTNTAVANAYPAAGSDHGYSYSLALAPGAYTACVWTIEPAGPALNAGCSTVTVATAPRTVAVIDSVDGDGMGIHVAGYAVDPTNLAATVTVAVNIGSHWYGFAANQPSAGAVTAFPGSTTPHGFVGAVPLPPGTYSACIWVSEPIGAATQVGCQSVTVSQPRRAVYHLDSIVESHWSVDAGGDIFAYGFAVWPDSPTTSVPLAIQVDSTWYGFVAHEGGTTSDEAQSAVPGVGPGHGFADGMGAFVPGSHHVCVWIAEPSGPAVNAGCREVVVNARIAAVVSTPLITGGPAGVSVSGYAIYPDAVDWAVGVAVNIGSTWTPLTANQHNLDGVVAVPGSHEYNGYSGTVPEPPGSYNACVWVAEPAGGAVNTGCRTVTVP